MEILTRYHIPLLVSMIEGSTRGVAAVGVGGVEGAGGFLATRTHTHTHTHTHYTLHTTHWPVGGRRGPPSPAPRWPEGLSQAWAS